MKKSIKSLIFVLLFVVTLPVTLFLSGCGATPSNEVQAVFFDSLLYDDEEGGTGYAVFEVDKGVTTKLDFKVNPSTWSGYAVTYAIKECSAQNRSRFTLENGEITVQSNEFEEIKVEVHISGHHDTCIVRLKEYPNDIFLYDIDGKTEVDELEVSINSFGSYTISPYGRFVDAKGNSYVRPLIEHDFNFKVESDDPTIIDVPNESRLKVCSVRSNVSSANVTVMLNDTTGKMLHMVKVKINVVLNASRALAIIDGYDKFAVDNQAIEIAADDLDLDENENLLLGVEVFFFGEDNRFIEPENTRFMLTVDNARYASVDGDTIIIEPNSLELLNLKVNIWSNLVKPDGTAYSLTLNLKIVY